MAVNPIETTDRIKNDYIGYLQSILTVKDTGITEKIHLALSEHIFIKGPYLEATPPFEQGCTLRELIEGKVASKEFIKIGKDVEIDRPLYRHQESAIRKSVQDRRNIIVSTGTGSGKTECFVYPILNALMRKNESGELTTGVRALLLYPMNALANDQMKRLRAMLANYPDITFGRYTGETIEKEAAAREHYRSRKEKEMQDKHGRVIKGVDYKDVDLEPLPNERISRQAMRENPPHILLTNYAMLEYLLIRPDDTVFFDGPLADDWQFIVLDEAHTYKGANGTEIALLLRRLKERVCGNRKNVIQCFATSATLGNQDAFPELAKFASDIFDEVFEVKDIVISERKRRMRISGMKRYVPADYERFKMEVASIEENQQGPWLYGKLSEDERIVDLLLSLEKKPKSIQDVAKIVFSEYQDENSRLKSLVSLIELGVMAKPDQESAALLPARYHLFVKALEGVYVSLYPKTKAFLDRKEKISTVEGQVSVFELANCQNCGQEYLIGSDADGYLKPVMEDGRPDYYMLTGEVIETEDVEINADDEAVIETTIKAAKAYELCTICGRVVLAGARKRDLCCTSGDEQKWIKVYKLIQKNNGAINTCASCGGISHNIIKRFMTANQPATYIVANSLYSMIPPQKIELPKRPLSEGSDFFADELEPLVHEKAGKSEDAVFDERGRKLLVFSDNRQEAAFFAAYLDNKYNQLMWRRLIIRELRKEPEGLSVDDLLIRLLPKAQKALLFPEARDLTKTGKENLVATYVMKELLDFERRQGLEGSGYVRMLPVFIKLREMQEWKLTSQEVWDLLSVMLDTLRIAGATTFPDNLNIEDEAFEPRNREMYFREAGSGKDFNRVFMGFLPAGNANNRRFDYTKKILEKKGFEKELVKELSMTLMKKIFELIRQLVNKGYVVQETIGNEGVLYRLNHKKWMVSYVAEEEPVHRCKRCGRITHHNILGVCPEFRCGGTLETMTAGLCRHDPYYTRMYEDEQLLPLVSKEHTAQLDREKAGELQAQFENGVVNVLSCSTTFEMGVDVGQLEAILLRNVPPETSNYVQRAGRAGRRTSATAFSVTYARRNSHDLNYFANPIEIINGKIKAPYIELKNDKIASRHVNSIVLAWFFRLYREYFKGNVQALAGSDGRETIVEVLKRELDKQPVELLETIGRVLDSEMMVRLGILEWRFADRLLGEEGTLTRAIEMKRSDIDHLKEMLRQKLDVPDGGKIQYTDAIVWLINTFEKQQTLAFLAASSVIPKYGFPVDVVKLDVHSNAVEAREIDLSRDLKMAISEYAPGSEVIAAGKVWRSHSLNRISQKEWPSYTFFECPACKKTTLPGGVRPIGEIISEESVQCSCGKQMKSHVFIIPIFGFSTSWDEKPKAVGESRPRKFYSTQIQFSGFDVLDPYQEEEKKTAKLRIADKVTNIMYSPQGKLVVMNRGVNGAGLFLCKRCGYAQTNPVSFEHKNKFGKPCPNKFCTVAALGHILTTDILKIEFPNRYIDGMEGRDQWISLLYAILEGASDALGISRADINGCLDRSGVYPALILFDEAAGGAGHVKHIHKQLDAVLKAAYRRVDGHCGCGAETSCYGCLRGYENQMEHDRISRGMAKDYLEWLLLEKTNTGVVFIQDVKAVSLEGLPFEQQGHKQYELQGSMQVVQQDNRLSDLQGVQKHLKQVTYIDNGVKIGEEWKKVLALLLSPEDDAGYRFGMQLIERGVEIAPNEVGFELRSEEFGVLGYEAEMVWHDRKIAVLAKDSEPEAKLRFNEYGWQVFQMGVDDVEKIAEVLI